MKLDKVIRKAQTEIDKTTDKTYLPAAPSSTRSTPVLEKNPACPDCNDTGYWRYEVPGNHPEFGKLHRCHCQAANDAHRLQELSGLSSVELSYRLGDIAVDATRRDTMAMVNACRNFIAKPAHILTIWGRSGNAKSVAMIGVVNALLEKKVEAVYVVAFDLINHIRQAFNQSTNEVKNDDAYSRLLRFERVEVLAVDELDKIFPLTAWEAKQVTDLIDHRHRFKMGTILTMNKDPQALFDGDLYHIYSRLKDGRNVIRQNNDSDLRSHIGTQA